MNNYYLLIYLSEELRNKLLGSELLRVITPYRDTLELYLYDRNKDEEFRLIFSADPNFSCLFTDIHRPAKKSNTLEFFTEVYGLKVKELRLTQHDRFINLLFDDHYALTFRLFGPNPNALLIRDGMVMDAFRRPEKEIGKKAPENREVQFFSEQPEGKKTRDKITGMNPLLPREVLDSLIEIHSLNEKSSEELIDFAKTLTQKLEHTEAFRVMDDFSIVMLDEAFLPGKQLKTFESADEAIRFAYRSASRENRIEDEKEDIEKELKKKLKKVLSSLKGLAKAEQGLEKADEYEKYGHLLMSTAHLSTDADSIEVDDFYNEGEKLRIPLKTGKNLAENAEYYYSKAKNSRESYEQAKKEKPHREMELKELQEAMAALETADTFSELRDWKKDFDHLIESNNRQKQETKAYYEAEAGSYSVWIGKNARSNDKLLQLSHKEDIWLHVRGVGGSHVIIRMNNQVDYPPMEIIERAASYAAFNSKLKGSELVPVIYTKRKFVRKPKGAAPGLVKVDREEVIMVNPGRPS
jgi:predicted ribosome quality control (RQC) complex YloA/Tae2 family protein